MENTSELAHWRLTWLWDLAGNSHPSLAGGHPLGISSPEPPAAFVARSCHQIREQKALVFKELLADESGGRPRRDGKTPVASLRPHSMKKVRENLCNLPTLVGNRTSVGHRSWQIFIPWQILNMQRNGTHICWSSKILPRSFDSHTCFVYSILKVLAFVAQFLCSMGWLDLLFFIT